MTAGSTGNSFPPFPMVEHEHRIGLFSPPYLLRPFVRPRIQAIRSAGGELVRNITYGETFYVESPEISHIGFAALIRPGAVTHTNDMEQRYIELPILGREFNSLRFEAPELRTVAPPGFYMLFLLSVTGVPSVSRFVKLG
jgi:hypothetical protein